MNRADLSADEQTAILADRYSQRADAYDQLWSPVIRPPGELLISRLSLSTAKCIIDVGTGAGALLPAIRRAAPNATILGVDRSDGMLRLAKQKHSGSLALMDVQNLALAANQFDAAVVAFVLFHVPSPERCLSEVNRVLKPAGTVGTVTWGAERAPMANAVWDEELEAAGGRVVERPATDNRACCDNAHKVISRLEMPASALRECGRNRSSIDGGLKTISNTRRAVPRGCGFCHWTRAIVRRAFAEFANG